MGKLNDKAAELADHIRHLENLLQMEIDVRLKIQQSYEELGVLISEEISDAIKKRFVAQDHLKQYSD